MGWCVVWHRGGMRVGGAAVVSALLLMAACTGELPPPEPELKTVTLPPVAPSPEPDPDVFPGKRWSRDDGGSFGAYDRALDAAGSTCVAVIKDGKLVHDAYWDGAGERSTRASYSITKSVTAILIGIAADEKSLDLDDPAADYIREWQSTAAEEVTIRDLLSNSSGRHWDYDTDYGQMIRQAVDKSAFAIGLGQAAEPGEVWAYNNSAVQTLEVVLEEATGMDVIDYARRRLFDPLGLRDTTWARDAAKNPTTYSGIDSSCLDLARLGLLMMRDGEWHGQQIVSKAFVDEATGRSSTALNAAYGLLWWVNKPGRVVEVLRAAGFPSDKPPYDGQLAPGVPKDAFWALGYGNEYVAVVPSKGIVAVRLGARPATPDLLTYEGFTRGAIDGAS